VRLGATGRQDPGETHGSCPQLIFTVLCNHLINHIRTVSPGPGIQNATGRVRRAAGEGRQGRATGSSQAATATGERHQAVTATGSHHAVTATRTPHHHGNRTTASATVPARAWPSLWPRADRRRGFASFPARAAISPAQAASPHRQPSAAGKASGHCPPVRTATLRSALPATHHRAPARRTALAHSRAPAPHTVAARRPASARGRLRRAARRDLMCWNSRRE
jgi:hypothetical protein